METNGYLGGGFSNFTLGGQPALQQNVSMMAMTANAPDRPTVQGALDEQVGAIAHLHKLLSELEARLSPVLELQPPSANGRGDDPRAAPSGLLSRVCFNTSAVSGAIAHVQSLIQRLHI